MSRAESQLRIFETLWGEMRAHVATDRNLPSRIQQRLAKEKRFGSRDRRLYRELLYTALRYLPWLENKTFASGALTALWLSTDTPATAPLKRELIAAAPPCPATIAQRAAILGQSARALLPAWFCSHCPAAFEAPNIDALHTRAPLWLRLQTDDANFVFDEFKARGWTWRRSDFAQDAIELFATNDPDLTQTESSRRGFIEIQDLGSQMILPAALGAHAAPGNWLDACAGAGGKTLQLARLLGPAARIDAADPRAAALAELDARARRAGLKNIRIVSPGAPAPLDPKFYDGILVDAPCSGTGTWRRSPHLKYCTRESAVHAAAKLQLEILARHAPLVRQGGGLLVYATCSLSRCENENVAAAFLAMPEHRDFALAQQTTILPAAHNTDGFFCATFRRS